MPPVLYTSCVPGYLCAHIWHGIFFYSCNHLFVSFASSAQCQLLSWQHLSLWITEAAWSQFNKGMYSSSVTFSPILHHHLGKWLQENENCLYTQLVLVNLMAHVSINSTCTDNLRHMRTVWGEKAAFPIDTIQKMFWRVESVAVFAV